MDDRYFAAYTRDENQIRKSASGGVAYEICRSMLLMEGVVYGVSYQNHFQSAGYIRVTDTKELYKLNGSKYITTTKKIEGGQSLFISIQTDLQQGRRVMMIGTPCEVGHLREFLEKHACPNQNLLLTVDFICQGPLIASAQMEYITYLEDKYKSTVCNFSVRHKHPNWTPVYLRAQFENGKEHIKPLYETDFGRAFMILGLEQCYDCRYKGDNHCSDITIGDFWGLKKEDNGFNVLGTSVVITHSIIGFDFIQSNSEIAKVEYDKRKSVGNNPMYSFSRTRHAMYDKFKKNYPHFGLHKTVFLTRSLPSKLKYMVLLCLGQKPY